jgi:hypothetical protein
VGVDVRGLRLTGAIDDPHVTWFERRGRRVQDVVWPPGYVARFRPDLEVLDPTGSVVAREGDGFKGRYDFSFNDLGICMAGRPAHVYGTDRMWRWNGNDVPEGGGDLS